MILLIIIYIVITFITFLLLLEDGATFLGAWFLSIVPILNLIVLFFLILDK